MHEDLTTERSLEGQHVVAFRFAIGQRVWIDDADIWGRVRQLNVSRSGKSYQVVYYDDDKVLREEWLPETELRSTKP